MTYLSINAAERLLEVNSKFDVSNLTVDEILDEMPGMVELENDDDNDWGKCEHSLHIYKHVDNTYHCDYSREYVESLYSVYALFEKDKGIITFPSLLEAVANFYIYCKKTKII